MTRGTPRPVDRPDAAARAVGDGPVVALTPEGFFTELRDDLVKAMTLRLGSRPVGEEIAQDAMARAWERWSDVSLMANPKGWVYRVAFDLASSRWRRHFAERRALRRLDGRPEATGTDMGTGTGTGMLLSVESVEMHAALAELSKRQKEVVILRYFLDYRVEETADLLGISPGTVKTQTHRALTRLRASIDLADGGDR